MGRAFHPREGFYKRDGLVKIGAENVSENEFAGYVRLDFKGKGIYSSQVRILNFLL